MPEGVGLPDGDGDGLPLGDGEGDGEPEDKVKLRLHGFGVTSWACGILLGTFGATGCCLS